MRRVRSVRGRPIIIIALVSIACVDVPDTTTKLVDGPATSGGGGTAGTTMTVNGGSAGYTGGTGGTVGANGGTSGAATAGAGNMSNTGGMVQCPGVMTTAGSICDASKVIAAGTCKTITDFGAANILTADGRDGVVYGLFGGPNQPNITFGFEMSTNGTLAAHWYGHDLIGWGGGIAVDLLAAANCYDVTAYAGIEFKARGSGELWLNVQLAPLEPSKLSPDYDVYGYGDGDCTSVPNTQGNCGCADHFGATVPLTNAWTSHSVVWSDLKQVGYGARTTFDPKKVRYLNFDAKQMSSSYTTDIWIDDVSFIPLAPHTGVEDCPSGGSEGGAAGAGP